MHLTLVISQLGRGGAERVTSNLANAWAEKGERVTLLSFDHGEPPAYALHPNVKVNSLGLLATSSNIIHGLLRNLRRLQHLRKAIRDSKPDIVISFMDRTNVLTILATRFLAIPIVVVEQTVPVLYDIGRIWSLLRRTCYRLSDGLVCPTASLVDTFRAIAGVEGVAIPNLVDVPVDLGNATERCDVSRGYVLAAMGRLVHEKGFDLLLTAFSQVASAHPDWTLIVLGGGPLLTDLQSQAESLGLGRRVQFLGPISDPFTRLRETDMFVLSSRFEGFGMALAEAMALGLPVVSFNCPEGPAEIIRDGVDGILVPAGDTIAMACAMDRLMRDTAERLRLALRAPEVIQRFGRDRVTALWQDLFNRLLIEDMKPLSERRKWSARKADAEHLLNEVRANDVHTDAVQVTEQSSSEHDLYPGDQGKSASIG